jgi:3-dehydroquinate synthase
VEIQSALRRYKVDFFPDLTSLVKDLGQHTDKVALIDSKVHQLFQSEMIEILKGNLVVIDALEENKTFEKCGLFLDKILALGVRKNTQLLVIGGGIVQDIGGFVASILYRGIDYALVPTTMLAQCDSCIGSKTSLNIGRYKNQIGTFYPPSRVLISPAFLGTLKKDDVKSGICEALKLAMIAGPEEVNRMKSCLPKERLNQEALQSLVKQALEIKKKYIENDEFDKGPRNLLNFGHTFGHAFESESNYSISHGQAVGLGILAAFYFSWRKGMIAESEYRESNALMMPWIDDHLVQLRGLNPIRLVEALKRDKKSGPKELGFILSRGFGKMERVSMPVEDSTGLLSGWLSSI